MHVLRWLRGEEEGRERQRRRQIVIRMEKPPRPAAAVVVAGTPPPAAASAAAGRFGGRAGLLPPISAANPAVEPDVCCSEKQYTEGTQNISD